MTMALMADMQQILRQFVSDTPGIGGAATVSSDGLVLASVLPVGSDEDQVSAMGAALLTLGERSVRELQLGSIEQVLVKGHGGYLVIMRVDDEVMLEAMTGSEAKLGMILLGMKRAVEELTRQPAVSRAVASPIDRARMVR
jgi:predicted regulator of Ras-like GTPase activity (Roadblock/LC7/MglB family)